MFHRVLFAALSILAAIGMCRAQTFVPVGTTAEYNGSPYAGRITAVAPVTRSIILIGTDGGQNWLPRTDRKRSLRITALSAAIPAAGSVLAYLVRTVNGCPGGTGSAGTDSSGGERAAPVCQ